MHTVQFPITNDRDSGRAILTAMAQRAQQQSAGDEFANAKSTCKTLGSGVLELQAH